MNYTNKNTDDEMSMEDILSSIRKYVSEDKESESNQDEHKEKITGEPEYDVAKDNIISLNETQIIPDETKTTPTAPKSDPLVYSEKSTLSTGVTTSDGAIPQKKSSPFEQLTNALNSYGKDKLNKAKSTPSGSQTVEQLFSEIAEKVIQQWVDSKMESFVEKIVMREIEKIKAE